MNPAQADVIGAMDKGRERQATDMAGDILGQTMGGKIGALAKLSPEKALALGQALGIPTNSKGRLDNMIGVTVMGAKLLEAGMFEEAAQFLGEEADKAESLTGEPATRLRLGQNAILTGDQEVMNNFMAVGRGLDPSRTQVSAKDQSITDLNNARAANLGSGGSGGLASAKTEILEDGTTIQAMPDGTTQVINPAGQSVTGQERIDVLKSAQKFRLNTLQSVADIAVAEAQAKAQSTQRASRVSQITSELSDRNRNSSRESVKLNQAFKLAQNAEQGLTGASKIQLAKLFPNIDVTNEALLSQSLTGLALEQLQNFKGPTTDFEYGIAEQIAGKIGDSKSANVARLKSLQRANWFNRREFDQFQKYVSQGKDPDTFGFDFGARVNTKKGDFSLQDLQDTAVENNLTIEEVIKRLDQ